MKPHNALTDPPLLKGALLFKCNACEKKIELPQTFRTNVDANSALLTYKDKIEVHECKPGHAGLVVLTGVVFETPKPSETKGAEKSGH